MTRKQWIAEYKSEHHPAKSSISGLWGIVGPDNNLDLTKCGFATERAAKLAIARYARAASFDHDYQASEFGFQPLEGN